MKNISRSNIICVIGVVAIGVAGAAVGEPPSPYARLMSQFADLDAISFGARVTVTLHAEIPGSGIAVGEPIEGFFEYVANDNRWRRSSVLDPTAYPGMNTTVAYDGSAYSYAMRDMGVISVSFTGPSRSTGMSLPNPIVELGRFCAPTDDENADILLASVRAGARAGVAPIDMAVRADGSSVVRCAGGSVHGVATTLVMRYGSDGLLNTVERRVTQNNTLLGVIKCGSYINRAGDNGRIIEHWPTAVTFIGMDPTTGKPGATIEMHLEWLSVGRDAIGSASFSPAWSESARIWLDELGIFIR